MYGFLVFYLKTHTYTFSEKHINNNKTIAILKISNNSDQRISFYINKKYLDIFSQTKYEYK